MVHYPVVLVMTHPAKLRWWSFRLIPYQEQLNTQSFMRFFAGLLTYQLYQADGTGEVVYNRR